MKKFLNFYYDTWFYRHIGSAVAHPKNFFFCLKFPFWKQTNVGTGKFSGYHYTFYEWIPEGGRKAFGEQLTADIIKALEDDNIPKRKWHKVIQGQDIKEKFGTLRLYAATTEKVQKILLKYEYISMGYCINCGKSARYRTSGWIEYYCEDCMKEYMANHKQDDYEKFRLTISNIPIITRRVDGKDRRVSLKAEYGVDLKKLWGLK